MPYHEQLSPELKHQLKGPLTTIRLYTEAMLSGSRGPVTAEQREYLEEIYRASSRMIDRINGQPTVDSNS